MLSSIFRFAAARIQLKISSKAMLLDNVGSIKSINLQNVARFSTSIMSNAGHSHWQNIKKQKTEGDRAKSVQFGRHTVSIKIAVREGNSPNPETNSLLGDAVKKALADGMPKASIQRVIERMSTKSGVLLPTHFEVKLASGAYAIVEAFTTKPVMVRSQLISVSRKFGFQLVVDPAQSSARRLFEHCGIVRVDISDRIPNLDAATELAIQVGANDVQEAEVPAEELEEEESTQQKVTAGSRSKSASSKVSTSATAADTGSKLIRVFEFICDPLIVSQVRTKLEDRQLAIRSAEDEFRPVNYVNVEPSFYTSVTEFYRKMSDTIAEVERVFDNLEVADSD